MHTNHTAGLCLLVIVAFAVDRADARAEELRDGPSSSLVVETSSGRQFHGDVDRRTDAEWLWIRSTHGHSSILRPIRWDRIAGVELDQDRYTGDEFLAAYLAIGAAIARPVPTPRHPMIRLAGIPEKEPSQPLPGLSMTESVQSLGIDAGVANWDDDVEADGFWLEIQPLSAWGAIVPVEATLSVDLLGRSTRPVNRPEPPIRLGRWSRRVTSADFGLFGAVYRFPFQAIHPSFEPGVAPDALVHVRLSVPGRGVFEASICPSRLRPYCSFRDELDRTTGRWFLPIERTGRSQRSW